MTGAANGGGARRRLVWGAGVAVAIGLAVWLAPGVCSLLLGSFIVAYVCAPAVDVLERRRVPRALAAGLVLAGAGLVILSLLLLLVPVVATQGRRIGERLPQAVAYVEGSVVPWVESRFGFDVPDTGAGVAERLGKLLPRLGAAAPVRDLVAKTFGGFLGVLAAVVNLVLVPVVAFHLLRRYHDIWPGVEALVPRRSVERTRGIMRQIDASLAGFVRGQLTVAFILGAMLAAGLTLVGLDGGVFIGLLSGFLNLIPYVGTTIGIVLSLLLAVFEFGGWGPIAGVLVVFAVAQTLEGMVLTPRILGDRVGLSPVVVILAVLVGGEVFGFAGLLLAVPAAAVLKVLGGVLRQAYLTSDAYDDAAAAALAAELDAPVPAVPGPEARPPES